MSRPCLETLPIELVDCILSHLSVPCLLAFGQTNKQNRSSAINALHNLELAIFPKPIHCMLAFIEASYLTENTEDERTREYVDDFTSSSRRTCWSNGQRSNTSSLYQIGLTTPSTAIRSSSRSPLRLKKSFSTRALLQQTQTSSQQPLALSLRTQEINTQNQLATRVLSSSYLINIQHLTLHMYNLMSSDLANMIATSFPNLKHLNLNFTHTYINDCTLSARYWRDTPGTGDGSPVWNAFSDINVNKNATDKSRLSTLQSLTLRRAGITSTQLRKWIQHNPNLSRLSLEKVRGVDIEFCDWLADYITFPSSASSPSALNRSQSSSLSSTTISKLNTINLEDCANLKMDNNQDFNWFKRICRTSGLHTLSLDRCKGVNETILQKIASRVCCSDISENYDSHDKMDIDVYPCIHTIPKLTSPKGTIYYNGVIQTHSNAKNNNSNNAALFIHGHTGSRSSLQTQNENQNQSYNRAGSVSPAMLKEGNMSGYGYGYWKEGPMEVDPDL